MRFVRLLFLCALLAGLPGCLTLFGRGPSGPGVLTLQNQMTGERITAQYRLQNGALDQAGLWQLSQIMRDVRTGRAAPIDPALFDYMVAIRNQLGMPPQAVIIITSGYRSPQTNDELRRRSRQVAENSYHVKGQAADIKIPGVSGQRVAAAARSLRRGGAAHYGNNDHVHIDTGPPRTWSTY